MRARRCACGCRRRECGCHVCKGAWREAGAAGKHALLEEAAERLGAECGRLREEVSGLEEALARATAEHEGA